MKKKKNVQRLIRSFSLIIKLIILTGLIAIGINVFVVKSTEGQIAATLNSQEDALEASEIRSLRQIDAECIMVLGASVHADGTPSPMLRDRLDAGIKLYHAGVAPKILLTGDDGQEEYNEVSVMRQYAIEHGVDEEDIFLDHAGFSTYESVYRAAYIFRVKRMIIVTQQYHLYRALYGCNRRGIEALGTAANQEHYGGQAFREIREILARDKDFVMWFLKPNPTFLGEAIPINGSGISTH